MLIVLQSTNMGKSKQIGNHNSDKHKNIARKWKTKRRTKDLDQIHSDHEAGDCSQAAASGGGLRRDRSRVPSTTAYIARKWLFFLFPVLSGMHI